MADPFELWRLMWSTAVSSGLEQLAEAVPGGATAARQRAADLIDLSAFPTLGRVRIELATMLLLEQREASRAKVPPLVIVAPYAVHDASIADFAPGHSLAQILAEADAGSVVLTFWKSATAEMRGYGIDVYLSDLNVAIDDLGARASLVGPVPRRLARRGLRGALPRENCEVGPGGRADRSGRRRVANYSRARRSPAHDGREPGRHDRRPDLRGAVPRPVVAAHGG